MSEKFFTVLPTAPEAWGLVGNYLMICENADRDEETGLLHIDCVGPDMLPVVMAGGAFVVSAEFRDWLAKAECGQFEFKPVIKRRVTEVNWREWNELSEDDIPIPRDVDLESYFGALPHSENAANAIGEISEWIIAPGGVLDFDVPVTGAPFRFHARLHLGSWSGIAIFRAGIAPGDENGQVVVTGSTRRALMTRWPNCFCFRECLVL
jgi:hypothetical protein